MRTICRLIFGITFVLSGFFKFVDPVGTSLIVKEYLEIFHLSFLIPASAWIGIIMSSAEFVIGSSVIIGLRMRIMSVISLVLISFFTLLTLYLAIFNPIADCGCFGEAVHLTNWQTFEKNVVLLTCCIVFVFKRKDILPVAKPAVEWLFIALFACIALSISIHSFRNLPFHDFTAYRTGVDLNNTESGSAQYESTFIYTKDGVEQEFTLDNLPDDSWEYVESVTNLVEGSTEMAQIDLALSDEDGNYWTDELFSNNSLAAVIVWDPYKLKDEQIPEIVDFVNKAEANGYETAIFSAAELSGFETDIYYADRKALMTLNRSNGGAVMFHNGIIADKLPSRRLAKAEFEQDDDFEFTLLKKEVAEKFKLSFVLVGIFVLILLVRYGCRMIHKRENEITAC